MKIIAKTSVTLILTLSLGVSAYPMASTTNQFAYVQKDPKEKDKPKEQDKKPPEKRDDKPKDDKGGKKGR